MKENHRKQWNNKGFTLVELLVTMAIMGVVAVLATTLIMYGSKWYAGETAKVEIQNEIQLINTQIRKILMEATVLNIKEESGIQYILTGDVVEETGKWDETTNPNQTARAIIIQGSKIYITDQYYKPGDVSSISKGYLYTEHLDEAFRLDISNEIQEKEGKSTITAPVSVQISYKLEKDGNDSNTKFYVTLRNSSSFTKIEKNGTDIYVE